jgi:ectoine hydroxylase-related dioxygenase (phytanoyl-CoA dioxygenase family)
VSSTAVSTAPTTALDDAVIDAALENSGFCVVPNVLSSAELEHVHSALKLAIERTTTEHGGTFNSLIDPNASSIRLNNLPDFDPIFVELLRHPKALPIMRRLLGRDAYVGNFSANIAMPGAGAMRIHSDQALIMPGPWSECLAMNIIWCFDDVRRENGATRYIPGSHLWQRIEEVPPDAEDRLESFTAPAGSIIAMEGRMWHTSGANTTKSERRAMAFAYYVRGFLRGQVNWDVTLSEKTKASLNEDARNLLGMGALSNYHYAMPLVLRDPTSRPRMRSDVAQLEKASPDE